jgi:hypothetical protein
MMHKVARHNNYVLAISLVALFISSICNAQQKGQAPKTDKNPVSIEAFLSNPVGYELTKANFQNNLPANYKVQIYLMKNKKTESKDSIIRFYYRKSELFVFKTYRGAERFFSGIVYDSRFQLINGISTGMTRDEFFNCFTNLEKGQKDTIKITQAGIGLGCNFIFKSNKLKAIKLYSK